MIERHSLIQKAKATLEANKVLTKDGPMLAAGGAHFRTLWVRDFCFSVGGLLAADETELVKTQLEKICSLKNKRGFLPRGLDVVSPKLRVSWNLFVRQNPNFMNYDKKPLKPEYLGEHNTPAFDSNLLFILAHSKYELKTGRSLFSREQLKQLLSIYSFGAQGLLDQPNFSDWQDSAKREGAILLTHLLYIKASSLLGLALESEQLKETVCRHFYKSETGLFTEKPDSEQISLDSHLFILNEDLNFKATDAGELYKKLKAHPIWLRAGIPGIPVVPGYSDSEISWTLKAIQMRHYHDNYVWGWLAAEAVKCAQKFGDKQEAERISKIFYQATEKDEFLAEIYSYGHGALTAHNGIIYKSEIPFSWTAAKWLEALT